MNMKVISQIQQLKIVFYDIGTDPNPDTFGSGSGTLVYIISVTAFRSIKSHLSVSIRSNSSTSL